MGAALVLVGGLGSLRPSGFAWSELVVGLVAAPLLMVSLGLVVGHYRSRPLRLTGPLGTGVNCTVIVALMSNHVTGPPAELFYGVSLFAAAWRGQSECEATVISNLILSRDDQIGCPMFSPIDHAERRHRTKSAVHRSDSQAAADLPTASMDQSATSNKPR